MKNTGKAVVVMLILIIAIVIIYRGSADRPQVGNMNDNSNSAASSVDIEALREIASKYPSATFERAEEEVKGSIPKDLPRLSRAEVYDIVERSSKAEDIISAINDVHKYPDFIYGIFGNVVYVLSDAAEDGVYSVWYGFDTKTESRTVKLIITRNNGSEIIREIEVLGADRFSAERSK